MTQRGRVSALLRKSLFGTFLVFTSLHLQGEILDKPHIQQIFTGEIDTRTEKMSSIEAFQTNAPPRMNYRLSLGVMQNAIVTNLFYQGESYLGEYLQPRYGLTYSEAVTNAQKRAVSIHLHLTTTASDQKPINAFFFTGLDGHFQLSEDEVEGLAQMKRAAAKLRAGFSAEILLTRMISLALNISSSIDVFSLNDVFAKSRKTDFEQHGGHDSGRLPFHPPVLGVPITHSSLVSREGI